MNILLYVLTAVIAYLLGSISVGIITSKLMGGPNLREVGSGNTGATNALRALGKKGGIIVFVGDILKALIASLIGRALCGHDGMLIAAIFVIAGHIWPVFFGFKGGKGVSCVCGAIHIAYNPAALLAYVIAIAVIAFTKYVSLGSCCMVLSFAILVTIHELMNGLACWYAIPWAFAIAALVIWRHKDNIVRLLNGTERKLGEKKN